MSDLNTTRLAELKKHWEAKAAQARHDREALATQREALTTPEARKRFTAQYITEQERGLASQASERWLGKVREAAAWRSRLRDEYQDAATRRRRYFRDASLGPNAEIEIAAIIKSEKICTDADQAIIRTNCGILGELKRMNMRHELQQTPLSELVALAETAPSDGERGAAMAHMIQREIARRPVPSADTDKDAWAAHRMAEKKIQAAVDTIPLPKADQAELAQVESILADLTTVEQSVRAMTDRAAAERLDVREKVAAVREDPQAFIDGVAARQQQHTARVKEAVTDLTRGAVLAELEEIEQGEGG